MTKSREAAGYSRAGVPYNLYAGKGHAPAGKRFGRDVLSLLLAG